MGSAGTVNGNWRQERRLYFSLGGSAPLRYSERAIRSSPIVQLFASPRGAQRYAEVGMSKAKPTGDERRRAPRFPSELQTACLPLARGLRDDPWPAEVRDISAV